MGASGGGTAAAPFGGGGGLGKRDGGVSADSGQETGDEAGVCSHARGGTPKGAPGRRRQLERDDSGMKTK